jgi:hypothetical protein
VGIHLDALAAERHAFRLEALALFKGGISAQLDLTAGSYDSLPWNAGRELSTQETSRLPGDRGESLQRQQPCRRWRPNPEGWIE